MPGLSTGFLARHPRFIWHSIHAKRAPRVYLVDCYPGRATAPEYKRNLHANCALGSQYLIPLGETPDYFHHSVFYDE